jgi:phenylacetate-CoA ligase
MGIGSRIRKSIFWSLDSLQGNQVQNHMADLDRALTDPEAAHAISQQRTRELLDHACNTTAYYRQFQGARELSDFPILQKRTIREHYDDFLSSAFDNASLVRALTSGSYGTPFVFLLTRDKKARQSAEVIYFGRWAGYDVGQPHAYVRVTRSKSWLKLLLQNELLLDPSVLTEERLESFRRVLLQRKVSVVFSYESTMRTVGEYCRARGDGPKSFSLNGIVLMAEPLRESTRSVLQQVFGCPVLSRYSTEETGVLAHECGPDGVHHINFASYVIEFLSPDSDAPVGSGQVGRVVITDLFSHAMPLIRYDIGDLATPGDGCSCGRPGPTLANIEGRAVEEVKGTGGQRISPFAINMAMKEWKGIIQFQFAQTGVRSYELRLQTLPSFNEEEPLSRHLQSLLGHDAELRISYVEEIPPLPSGKRPYIVNEYQQRQAARGA